MNSTAGPVHGTLVHHGMEAFVSHSGEAQAPYYIRVAHAHEVVSIHRLVHSNYGGRVGSHAHRFLLFSAEGQTSR